MASFRPEVHTKYDNFIREAAKEAGISWLLLKAIVAAESSFRADAYRPEGPKNGSYGLAQILLSTARGDYGFKGPPELLFDPETNLSIAADYLARLHRVFGDVRLVIAAYNAGPGRVRTLQRQHGEAWESIQPHLPPITKLYVPKVLRYMAEFAEYHEKEGGDKK